MDDSTPGQVYFHIGTKSPVGTEIERAGLTGGILSGLCVHDVPLEDRTTGLAGETRFELVSRVTSRRRAARRSRTTASRSA
jgi:hypothetical protein